MTPIMFVADSDDDDDVDYIIDSVEEEKPLEWTSGQALSVNVAHSNGGRARCTECGHLYNAARMVFGTPLNDPWKTEEFYCIPCAKKLGVTDFTIKGGSSRIDS